VAHLLQYHLYKYLSYIAIFILTSRNISIRFAKEGKRKQKLHPSGKRKF